MTSEGARPRLLLVDDETPILDTFQRAFRAAFVITVASSPAEANALLDVHEFDVVVSDYSMPGGDGVTFLRGVAARKPALLRFLMTAHFDHPAVVAARDAGLVVAVFPKPWKRAELVAAVEAATSKARAQSAIRE